MILFLYGSDTFRLLQKQREILDRYKKIHKSGLNLKYFDFKKDTFEEFRDAFQCSSIFTEKKLFILENASFNSQFKEKFLQRIKEFQDSPSILLFVEKGGIERDPFFQELRKYSKFQDFKPLTLSQVKYLARKMVREFQKEIEERALWRLLELIGNDLWQLQNEIQKLVSFQTGKTITLKDVEQLVSESIEVDIFKTLDAIAANDKKKALKLLNALFERGENFSFLFAMMKYQFKNLLLIRDLLERGKDQREIFSLLHLHPYTIKKLLPLSRRFQKEKLKRIYFELFDLENKIKTGALDPKLSLELFVARI